MKESGPRDTRARFEQWAHNPTCRVNTASAVHGIKLGDLAKEVGVKKSMGQSPFALARGVTFEKTLLAKEAEILKTALHEAGVVGSKVDFEDFRIKLNSGKLADLDEAVRKTQEFLRAFAAKPGRPVLCAAATVRVPGGAMLPEAILVIDVLVAGPRGRASLMVGEVKTYPDRGGYTDPGELALARAQAGVYVHGLRLMLREMGIETALRVEDEGFLVLTRPGFNRPSVRAHEDLRFQAARAGRGFERLFAAGKEISGEPEGILKLLKCHETDYQEACLSFCDLAQYCHARAQELGDPAILGDDAHRFLGAIGLHRAVELMNGAKPANPAEKDLVRRLAAYEGRLKS